MSEKINKIINWIENSYTRLNYKEELLLVNYIKQLQQENKQLKEHIEKYEHYCKTTGIEELMKENKKYKEVIDKAINNSQYWIDYYTRLNSDERIALRLQENIDIFTQMTKGRHFDQKYLEDKIKW